MITIRAYSTGTVFIELIALTSNIASSQMSHDDHSDKDSAPCSSLDFNFEVNFNFEV